MLAMAVATDTEATAGLALRSRVGRLALAATVAASSMASLDATVVNVALPHIGADLDASVSALQWVLTGYLLALASLILLGGALGDRLRPAPRVPHRHDWFAGASLLCGVAPNIGVLIAARVLQGVGGALLTPGSLAILQASFREADRARGGRRLVGPRGRRRRHRPVPRRRAGGRPRLAVGVPDQRPRRRSSSSLSRGRPCRRPRDRHATGQARHPGRRLRGHRPRVRDLGAHRGRARVDGATPTVVAAAVVAVVAIGGLRRARPSSAEPARAAGAVPGPDLHRRQPRHRASSTPRSGSTFFLVATSCRSRPDGRRSQAGVALLPTTRPHAALFSARSGALAQRIGPRAQLTVGPLV